MECSEVWIGAQTAALLTGKSRQHCYRLADDRVVASRHDQGTQRLTFSLESLLTLMHLPPEPGFCGAVHAADAGDAQGMLQVGLYFLQQQHLSTAFACLAVAADKGNPDAMDWLSTCYMEAIGTSQDPARALRWLGEAAALGHPLARAKLAALEQGASLGAAMASARPALPPA